MIMEYVEGSTLDSIMRNGRIPLRDCVNYVSQVLAALSYAHAHGVVHRDIKPPNMMLTPEGTVKLMDFGIAKISVDHKLTQTGRTLGSLFYMSPEQIRGIDVDARSDLYSLGISLYEMVTGRRPFEGESDYSIMAAHLQQQPMPPVQLDPGLPPGLNDVIMMSIAKETSQRFQTAEAFRGALQSVEKDIGVGVSAAANAGATHIFGRAPGPPPPPPPIQSQPQYPPMPPPPSSQPAPARGHRGLYMVLGSVVTIGILAAGAVYLPRMFQAGAHTGSGQQPVAGQVQPQAPQVQPGSTPPPAAAEPSAPAQSVDTTPTQTPSVAPPVVQTPSRRPAEHPMEQRTVPAVVHEAQAPPQQSPPVVQQPLEREPARREAMQPSRPAFAENNSPEVQELRQRRMQMHSRIEAINASMRQLEQEQRRMGLGMSGDLVSRQHRMVLLMETFGEEMKNGNVAAARTALDNAERELDKLEEHFGR
jgi:serine/threonine-protein kinase